MSCRCPQCTKLYIYPEMPYMDPPSVVEAWANHKAEWKVACNWLGPLIDGRATLIRKDFTTDGGSIPQAAWSIVGHPFQMPCLPYFLQHDADCAAELWRLAVTDARLYKAMVIDQHISLAKRQTIFRSVRDFHALAGQPGHTPESVAAARRFCSVVGEEEFHFLSASRELPLPMFSLPSQLVTSNL